MTRHISGVAQDGFKLNPLEMDWTRLFNHHIFIFTSALIMYLLRRRALDLWARHKMYLNWGHCKKNASWGTFYVTSHCLRKWLLASCQNNLLNRFFSFFFLCIQNSLHLDGLFVYDESSSPLSSEWSLHHQNPFSIRKLVFFSPSHLFSRAAAKGVHYVLVPELCSKEKRGYEEVEAMNN